MEKKMSVDKIGKMSIMLVEDDEFLAGEIKAYLEKWGYRTILPGRFEDIMETFAKRHPQLVLMDINLPFFDGFYWCRRIREISQVPVLYISSRCADSDQIMAVAQGGDDYVEKPFRLELLKAKIDALLRRTYQYKVRERVYLDREIYFEQERAVLSAADAEVELTKSEQRILSKLLECRPGIVTRDTLMNVLWDTDEFVSDGTLTTLICRLRNKLQQFCGGEVIRTKKGQGYYIA